MDSVFNLYIHNPIGILVVAAIFFVAYWLLRRSETVRASALLTPAIAWGVAALWEWVIARFSPEANIRVDLLLIIPLLVILSLWGIIQAFWWKTA